MKEGIYLFKHEKQLFHPVEIERPNPRYAALLQEQLGHMAMVAQTINLLNGPASGDLKRRP